LGPFCGSRFSARTNAFNPARAAIPAWFERPGAKRAATVRRAPGDIRSQGRLKARERTQSEGIEIAADLYERLRRYAEAT
jgi:LDH2 family malate/lactate/ureidoglycolate dehydrogenase